ncbi:hypothetical protein KPL74_14145 [Bacillus sp. NP157]|nr:hypothetical protein KPL74_14145 [Bacillus sp. NP157]
MKLFPFGLLVRRREEKIDVIEIQADKYDSRRFQVVLYAQEVPRLIEIESAKDVDFFEIATPDSQYRLCATRWGRHFFGPARFKKILDKPGSATLTARTIESLIPQVDDVLIRNRVGPNIKMIGPKLVSNEDNAYSLRMSNFLKLIHTGFAASIAAPILVIVPSQVASELGYLRSRHLSVIDSLLPVFYVVTYAIALERRSEA